MDAGRPRLLGNTGNQLFYFFTNNHHHVSKFVDYHHNRRQRSEVGRGGNLFARFVVILGLESRVGNRLPGFFSQVLRQRLNVRGFIQSDFNELFPRFEQDMGQWLREGRIQYREDIVQGLDAAPDAFFGLLQGRNFGKLVVKLD